MILNKNDYEAAKELISKSENLLALLTSVDEVMHWNKFHRAEAQISHLKHTAFPINLVFYTPKQSCLTNEISRVLLELLATGENKKVKRHLLLQVSRNTANTESVPKSLTFGHLEGIFVIYFVGIGASVACFVIEMLLSVKRRRKKKFARYKKQTSAVYPFLN